MKLIGTQIITLPTFVEQLTTNITQNNYGQKTIYSLLHNSAHKALFREILTYLLIYLSTYLLTRWNRVLLEKLTDFQPIKKFSAFYGTRRFITAFTSTRHLSLSSARSIQSIPHIPIPEDPF